MILDASTSLDTAAAHAGGKGYNLFRLSQWGMEVPPFFVISTEAFVRTLESARIDLSTADPDSLARAIEAAPVPAPIAQAIVEARRRLPAALVAVRSSALAEDSGSHSFAGQLKSFLYVEGEEQLLEAVRGCWASAFSSHALAYMQQHRLPVGEAQVAVVVQAMIDSEQSGVAFTLDPVSGARDRLVISAVHGQGEGLVSGRLDADTFHLCRTRHVVLERTLADKTTMLVRGNGNALDEQPVPADRRHIACLADDQLADLARTCLTIERQAGRPQDIEWAQSGGRLYVLQTRPITTARGGQTPIQIWDNANIVESYAGVTSPLTFTFARNAYYHVYVQFCQVMGVKDEEVEKRDHVLRNMLGYLDGRVYYNLLNWYTLVGLFPGFKNNRQFMEGMMGVRETLPADAQALLALPSRAGFRDRWAARRLGLVMAARFVRLDSIVSRFRAFFDDRYRHYASIDVRGKSLEELLALYREMDDVFLQNWKAPIINDFFAMVTFGLLRKWTGAWKVDDTGSLHNDLLCGEGGVDSALPTERLMDMADAVRNRPSWRAAFERLSPAELRRSVDRDDDFAELRQQIAEYLDQFGFRCMNELKLEERDLHSDPTFLYQSIKNYVTGNPPTVAELRRREQSIRQAAETKARERLGSIKRRLYFWILGHARKTVVNRENLRLSRTKVFGLVRRIMDAIGVDLATRGALADPLDVYFLTLQEIESLVDASLVTQDLAALVDIRRRERARFEQSEPDERFVTRGAPYLGNLFRTEKPPPSTDGLLRGIGCCPGQVTARAKVIASPADDMSLDGDILVARRTDPGWTPLFPAASGVLVERGSLLSHSAIVARELGIPCVVGIPGLLDHIGTGDMVEMDGGAGWARIRPAEPSE